MSVTARLRRLDRPLLALLAVTVVALLARLVLLGQRIAHWDEGRVGYDVLRYIATGAWQFRSIVHGPFLPHVNRVVFEAIGPSDFSARLVVAVVGALLPLSAWLYREHLRDAELVALGLFLAFDPILLYYSRFMRNDVLVATFAFAALGFYVRLLDTRRRRYLYVGTAALALAFTTKENAVVYVVSVVGAVVLLLDHRLFLAREADPSWADLARGHLGRTARGLWAWRVPLALALAEFVLIWLFFYAPREAATGGAGLWAAVSNPSMLPEVVKAATYNPAPCSVTPPATPELYCDGALERIGGLWLGGPHQDHAYLPFLGHYLWVLATASGGIALLAVLGFVHDRYAGDRPRDLVALGFYWGFVSVLGYPVAVDIRAAWTVTHAVVPLAIPAAAGAALVYRWGLEAHEAGDGVGLGLAAVVLLLVGGQLAGTAVTTSYLDPQGGDNVLVQYAQPEGDLREALEVAGEAAREHEGLDVLWYGDHFHVRNESAAYRLPIGDGEWYNRLPLPWYLEIHDASVDSTDSATELADRLAEDPPPVVITRAPEATEIVDDMAGYREFRGEGRQPVGGSSSLVFVIYVHEDYADDAGAEPGALEPPVTDSAATR